MSVRRTLAPTSWSRPARRSRTTGWRGARRSCCARPCTAQGRRRAPTRRCARRARRCAARAPGLPAKLHGARAHQGAAPRAAPQALDTGRRVLPAWPSLDRDVRPLIDEVSASAAVACARPPAPARRPNGWATTWTGLVELPLAAGPGAAAAAVRETPTLRASTASPLDGTWPRWATCAPRSRPGSTARGPFVVLDSADSSKYGFSEEHNAARFIALPDTYAGKPCEQLPEPLPGRVRRRMRPLRALPEALRARGAAARHESLCDVAGRTRCTSCPSSTASPPAA